MAAERVFLVDGTALVYRAHFAFLGNPMIDAAASRWRRSSGSPTPSCSCCSRRSRSSWAWLSTCPVPPSATSGIAEYKAHRPPMPEELATQLPKARRLAGALGARVLEREGVEADDLIGTHGCAWPRAAGHETVIVSADKDFMQLVGPGVRQWIPPARGGPGEWIDAEAVRARWGVGPERMIDLLALMGDASDNVPGVKGIGPKTAAELLARFGSLDGVYSAPRGAGEEGGAGESGARSGERLPESRARDHPHRSGAAPAHRGTAHRGDPSRAGRIPGAP